MPLSTGAAIATSTLFSAGTQLLGSRAASRGAERAGDAELRATELAIEEQREAREQAREDFAPFRVIGSNALAELARASGLQVTPIGAAGTGATGAALDPATAAERAGISPERATRLLGNLKVGHNIGPEGEAVVEALGFQLGPPGPTGRIIQALPGEVTGQETPQFQVGLSDRPAEELAREQTNALLADFESSPEFEFVRGQGEQAIERGASARGLNLSGNALQDLSKFNTGLAQGEFANFANRRFGRFDQFLNRLGQLAGIGSSATGATAQSGTGTAANIGNALLSGGQAAANRETNLANITAGTFGGLANSANRGVENLLLMRALDNSGVTGAG